jgi:hypothetical protein
MKCVVPYPPSPPPCVRVFRQMALQLAYFTINNGKLCATYESNSTRGFLHGRTETVRGAVCSTHRSILRVFGMCFAG